MKTLDLGIKVNKNQVALSRIFLHSLGLYGEVQDLSLASTKATENTKAFTSIKWINIEWQNDYCFFYTNAGFKYIVFV
jgi:hypothetical protein